MRFKIILFFSYILYSIEEIINNCIYYIKYENYFLNHFVNKLFLSEKFNCPNSEFKIIRKINNSKETLYTLGKISSEFQLSYLDKYQLTFEKNKNNNLQLWYLIKNKNDNFFIKNINGCYIIIDNSKIICSFIAEDKATAFNIIRLFSETEKNMNYSEAALLDKEPIDILIKYIDLYDPNLNRSVIHQIDKDYENEELRYSLRSILTNIPWVRKIFIVMPNEKVRYLKNYNLIEDKIVYIKDKDVLGYDSSNSNSFEFNYWRIKNFGLSDNVIVMDDDCFIGKNLKKSDFFYVDNGKILPVIPTYNFIKLNNKFITKKFKIYKKRAENSKVEQTGDIFCYSKFITFSFIFSIFNISNSEDIFVPDFTHNAIPLNLQEINEAYNLINNSIYKYPTLDAPYRHIKSIQFQSFMLSYNFLKHKRKINHIPFRYISLYRPILLSYISSLFCINKGAHNFTLLHYYSEKIVLEYLFPNPSPYEIHNYSLINISFYATYLLNIKLKRNSKILMNKNKQFLSLLLLLFLIVVSLYIKSKHIHE